MYRPYPWFHYFLKSHLFLTNPMYHRFLMCLLSLMYLMFH
jgi:hypothetical protein